MFLKYLTTVENRPRNSFTLSPCTRERIINRNVFDACARGPAHPEMDAPKTPDRHYNDCSELFLYITYPLYDYVK